MSSASAAGFSLVATNPLACVRKSVASVTAIGLSNIFMLRTSMGSLEFTGSVTLASSSGTITYQVLLPFRNGFTFVLRIVLYCRTEFAEFSDRFLVESSDVGRVDFLMVGGREQDDYPT